MTPGYRAIIKRANWEPDRPWSVVLRSAYDPNDPHRGDYLRVGRYPDHPSALRAALISLSYANTPRRWMTTAR